MSDDKAQAAARDDVYRGVIMAHARQPRHFGVLADATRRVERHNPLCGDRIALALRVAPGGDGDGGDAGEAREVVAAVMFEGEGCALSQASASMLTEAIEGRTLAAARALHATIARLMAGAPREGDADLGELAALASVRAFPLRIKCVTLAWDALAEALSESRSEPRATPGRSS